MEVEVFPWSGHYLGQFCGPYFLGLCQLGRPYSITKLLGEIRSKRAGLGECTSEFGAPLSSQQGSFQASRVLEVQALRSWPWMSLLGFSHTISTSLFLHSRQNTLADMWSSLNSWLYQSPNWIEYAPTERQPGLLMGSRVHHTASYSIYNVPV